MNFPLVSFTTSKTPCAYTDPETILLVQGQHYCLNDTPELHLRHTCSHCSDSSPFSNVTRAVWRYMCFRLEYCSKQKGNVSQSD